MPKLLKRAFVCTAIFGYLSFGLASAAQEKPFLRIQKLFNSSKKHDQLRVAALMLAMSKPAKQCSNGACFSDFDSDFIRQAEKRRQVLKPDKVINQKVVELARLSERPCGEVVLPVKKPKPLEVNFGVGFSVRATKVVNAGRYVMGSVAYQVFQNIDYFNGLNLDLSELEEFEGKIASFKEEDFQKLVDRAQSIIRFELAKHFPFEGLSDFFSNLGAICLAHSCLQTLERCRREVSILNKQLEYLEREAERLKNGKTFSESIFPEQQYFQLQTFISQGAEKFLSDIEAGYSCPLGHKPTRDAFKMFFENMIRAGHRLAFQLTEVERQKGILTTKIKNKNQENNQLFDKLCPKALFNDGSSELPSPSTPPPALPGLPGASNPGRDPKKDEPDAQSVDAKSMFESGMKFSVAKLTPELVKLKKEKEMLEKEAARLKSEKLQLSDENSTTNRALQEARDTNCQLAHHKELLINALNSQTRVMTDEQLDKTGIYPETVEQIAKVAGVKKSSESQKPEAKEEKTPEAAIADLSNQVKNLTESFSALQSLGLTPHQPAQSQETQAAQVQADQLAAQNAQLSADKAKLESQNEAQQDQLEKAAKQNQEQEKALEAKEQELKSSKITFEQAKELEEKIKLMEQEAKSIKAVISSVLGRGKSDD